MIHYILQTLVFMLLFLVVYDLFLKKETFFFYNRLYLIFTPIASFLLPLIKIDGIQEQIPQQFMVTLPAVIIGGVSNKASATLNTETSSEAMLYNFTLLEVLNVLWIVGMVFGLVYLGYKLYRIFKLKKSGIVKKTDTQKIILLPETDTAFTFFNTIFLGDQLNTTQQKNILAHERIHVQQKHFIDLLFFELLRVVFWFNPLVYIYQKRVSLLQEFSADAAVASQINKRDYYQELLSQVFRVQEISFINTFFNQSFIKKRISMLQKSKSKKIVQLKYLLLVPIVCGMLIYTSCSNDKTEIEAELTTENDTEVMQKINELSEAIMKKGDLTEEEAKALKFLSTEAKPGDKVYTSVQEYLDDSTVVEIEEVERGGVDVPFAVIDQVPAFPGCEALDNEAAKICMSQKIQEFVGNNFNTDLANNLALRGKQRISMIFKINKNGDIQDVQARAPHEDLKKEAIRVISSLPKMTAGEHKGKKVNVLYNLPILFQVNE